MLLLPELYYFFDQKDFPFQKAFEATSVTVGGFCDYYYAKLITPKRGVKDLVRSGKLPHDPKEKTDFIANLSGWINSNSVCTDLFALHFDRKEIDIKKGIDRVFDHHDDTCCWFMRLTTDEFDGLKKAWKRADLPTDLFYMDGDEVCIIHDPSPFDKFLSNFGIHTESRTCLSPKRHEERLKNGK